MLCRSSRAGNRCDPLDSGVVVIRTPEPVRCELVPALLRAVGLGAGRPRGRLCRPGAPHPRVPPVHRHHPDRIPGPDDPTWWGWGAAGQFRSRQGSRPLPSLADGRTCRRVPVREEQLMTSAVARVCAGGWVPGPATASCWSTSPRPLVPACPASGTRRRPWHASTRPGLGWHATSPSQHAAHRHRWRARSVEQRCIGWPHTTIAVDTARLLPPGRCLEGRRMADDRGAFSGDDPLDTFLRGGATDADQ